jgi:hypothetical protein
LLPLIQNFSRVRAALKRYYGEPSATCGEALAQLQLEERATRLYALLSGNRPTGHLNRDYFTGLVTPER